MNPPIFILDDALSSVDIQTEERLLEGLEKFLQGKTTILITHRIAPLRKADRIVVLDEGKVVEIGTHTTLLARGEPMPTSIGKENWKKSWKKRDKSKMEERPAKRDLRLEA